MIVQCLYICGIFINLIICGQNGRCIFVGRVRIRIICRQTWPHTGECDSRVIETVITYANIFKTTGDTRQSMSATL